MNENKAHKTMDNHPMLFRACMCVCTAHERPTRAGMASRCAVVSVLMLMCVLVSSLWFFELTALPTAVMFCRDDNATSERRGGQPVYSAWQPEEAAEAWPGDRGADPFYETPWGSYAWQRDVGSQRPSVDCRTSDVAPAEHWVGLDRARKRSWASVRSDVEVRLDQLFCHAQWQNHVLRTTPDHVLRSGKWPVVVYEPQRGLADALGSLGRDMAFAFDMRALFFFNDRQQWYWGEHHPLQSPMDWLWHENAHRFGCDYATEFNGPFTKWVEQHTHAEGEVENFIYVVSANVEVTSVDHVPHAIPPWSYPTLAWLYQPSRHVVDVVRPLLAEAGTSETSPRSTYYLVGMHIRTLFVKSHKGNITDWVACWNALRAHAKVPSDVEMRLWISSEEQSTVDTVLRSLPDDVAARAMQANGPRSHVIEHVNAAGTLMAFVDFFALQRSDWLLDTVQSTWSYRVRDAVRMKAERVTTLGKENDLPDWCKPK